MNPSVNERNLLKIQTKEIKQVKVKCELCNQASDKFSFKPAEGDIFCVDCFFKIFGPSQANKLNANQVSNLNKHTINNQSVKSLDSTYINGNNGYSSNTINNTHYHINTSINGLYNGANNQNNYIHNHK